MYKGNLEKQTYEETTTRPDINCYHFTFGNRAPVTDKSLRSLCMNWE